MLGFFTKQVFSKNMGACIHKNICVDCIYMYVYIYIYIYIKFLLWKNPYSVIVCEYLHSLEDNKTF